MEEAHYKSTWTLQNTIPRAM